MYRTSPSLVFAAVGQARIEGQLSPEDEGNVLAKLLTHWALRSTLDASEVCANQPRRSVVRHFEVRTNEVPSYCEGRCEFVSRLRRNYGYPRELESPASRSNQSLCHRSGRGAGKKALILLYRVPESKAAEEARGRGKAGKGSGKTWHRPDGLPSYYGLTGSDGCATFSGRRRSRL